MGIDKRGKISALKGRKLPLEIRKKISATLQGIEINQWINFKLGENKLERKKFQDQMQKQVFERDNYTCQLCGQIGGKLQVDHIQSWADYVILRFSMDNCRTLCMACHYKITFGRNMPENVENWGHHSFERGVTK